MRRIFVYADFDWLPKPELVGELGYESLRGSDSFGFTFCKEWLKRHSDLILSFDISNFPGQQFTQPGRDVFGCFSDALPDRWGRTLLLRREQLTAAEEKRPVRRLSSFDFLTGIDDFSRMGAFRFKDTIGGGFINESEILKIPPLTNIKELLAASDEIEKSELGNSLPAKKWLAQLVRPGSSLGGARPKSSVLDAEGELYVAKFPSQKDNYDAGLWEHFSHLLADEAGINAARTKVVVAGGKYHTLLSERFDRTREGRRVHFASAMTLLGLADGDNAMTGHGYLDIVDFIVRGCTDVESNLQEIYRRVAFNICIGNSDDHFRNHGFLLTPNGWTLSPAYDMNPTLSEYQSLLISSTSNRANLADLLDACVDYLLSPETAKRIISEVSSAISGWRALATRLGISAREIEMFASVFDGRRDIGSH